MRRGLTNDEVEANRSEIASLLQSTGRKGMDKVLEYLDGVGFYTAPSSTDRHHNWYGGLAQHSLGVCRKALRRSTAGIDRNSVIIATLLHDICKASRLYYGPGGRIFKRGIRIKGHGSRSLLLLKREGLELTREERLAIRWHMGTWSAKEDEADDACAALRSPLWALVKRCDGRDAHEWPAI